VNPDRIVGVLDDLREQYDRAHELELPVYLIRTKYNRLIQRAFTFGNLTVAREILVGKVNVWLSHPSTKIS
jgi:hypothetical protein